MRFLIYIGYAISLYLFIAGTSTLSRKARAAEKIGEVLLLDSETMTQSVSSDSAKIVDRVYQGSMWGMSARRACIYLVLGLGGLISLSPFTFKSGREPSGLQTEVNKKAEQEHAGRRDTSS